MNILLSLYDRASQKRNGVPRKLFFSLGCNDEAGKESLQRKRQLFWG